MFVIVYALYLSKKRMDDSTQNYISRGVIYINDPSTCFICKNNMQDITAVYCTDCGFPQNGEQAAQATFYREHLLAQKDFTDAIKNVKSARNTLFVTAGLCVLGGFLLAAIDPDNMGINMLTQIILAGIFIALGFWASQNPLAAAICGLVLYCSVLLLSFIISIEEGHARPPIGIIQVVVIIFLAKGIKGALNAEKWRKEKGWDWKTRLEQ